VNISLRDPHRDAAAVPRIEKISCLEWGWNRGSAKVDKVLRGSPPYGGVRECSPWRYRTPGLPTSLTSRRPSKSTCMRLLTGIPTHHRTLRSRQTATGLFLHIRPTRDPADERHTRGGSDQHCIGGRSTVMSTQGGMQRNNEIRIGRQEHPQGDSESNQVGRGRKLSVDCGTFQIGLPATWSSCRRLYVRCTRTG
jgi:hypothetical protein